MADLEKTVAIIFEGVDQMGSGVDSATKRVDGVADAVSRASQPMADFTKDVFAFEAALLAAGVAVTGFAVKLAGDFDSQFREISTLIDAPAESLAGFRQEILDYSSESTQSLESVSSALYNAISAGVDYADSVETVAAAERLAVAGKADLDQALTTLVSSLNAYGLEMSEAERFSDLLFQTVRQGQTTLPELGNSLAQVTGLAASAGVSFDELLAAVATLTATGSTTSSAVTQIQQAISNILKPTKQAADLADELGIEFNAAALESKGLSGVLEDVGEATGGNTEQMAQLFGSVQALNGVLTLTGLGAESFAGNIEAMGDATGATEEAYSRMAGTIEQGTQRIQNAMTGALIAVGDPLLDEFGGIQDAIAAIFNAIGASVSGGQLEGFVDQLESMMGGMEQTLRDVAENLPEALESADFSAFFNGIELVREAISDLFDGADLTSAEGLARVIEILGLGFETLSAYTAGAITAIGPFLEQLASLTRFVLELDPALIAIVGTIGGLSLALNTLSGAVTTVTGLFRAFAGSSGVVAKATPIFSSLVSVLTGPLGLVAAAGLAGKGIYDATTSLIDSRKATADARREFSELAEAVRDGRLVWDYAIEDWVAAGEAQETLADRTAAANSELRQALAGISDDEKARREQARAIDEVNAKYRDYEAEVEAAYRQSDSFRQEQESLTGEILNQLDAIGPLGEQWKKVGDNVYENVSNIEELKRVREDAQQAFDKGLISEAQLKNVEDYYTEMIGGAAASKDAQTDLAGEVLTTEEAILKARDAVLEQELALEKLASNERIKAMEFSASIAVADIEADAKKVEAVLGATSTTIEATAGAVDGLFSSLAGGDLSFRQQWDLEDAIEQQLKIQKEAGEAQNKVLKAQAEMMKAKTEALRSGDGLVKIDSTGLEPALEMILWEILEKVQLRANAEGAEFLLGLS